MSQVHDTHSRWTRRTVLRRAAAVPLTAAVAGTARAESSVNARVATLNLGLGVSLAPFLSTDDETERRHVVGNLYESVEASNVSRRMAVLAEELVAVEADVIALQEAALVSAADEGTVDFLDELTAALNDGNSDYRVAAVSETTVVSLPGDRRTDPV